MTPPSSTSSSSHRLTRAWQSRNALSWALWPVSLGMGALVRLRRALYRSRLLRSAHPGLPVIVVGNVIAGGAGKTPVVIALVQHLQRQGWKPAVISRGYGRKDSAPHLLQPGDGAETAGDEPLLIARKTGVPVAVAAQRLEAARLIRQHAPQCDILISDDGLQHLALQRDLEICVFNDQGIGNGWLLPAGPLREPWPRAVDWVLYAGTQPPPGNTAPAFRIQRRLAPLAANGLRELLPLGVLQPQRWHAVAGVARPQDFFAMLQDAGLRVIRTTALPDHANIDSYERVETHGLGLICTEKDAAKLWRHHPKAWAVGLELAVPPEFWAALDQRLTRLRPGASPASMRPR